MCRRPQARAGRAGDVRHTGKPVTGLSFSHDGKLLAFGRPPGHSDLACLQLALSR
jgi:hypothetical protein